MQLGRAIYFGVECLKPKQIDALGSIVHMTFTEFHAGYDHLM